MAGVIGLFWTAMAVWSVLPLLFLLLFSNRIGLSGGWKWLLLIGGARIIEIVVVLINVTFLDEYRTLYERIINKNKEMKPYTLAGFRRLALLAVHNYFEVLFWFGAFYAAFAGAFCPRGGVVLESISGALYFSTVTMTTLGYGDITPLGTGAPVGILLTCLQTLIGVLIAIIIFARVLSLVPRPVSQDKLEQ
jgi:hypothetical protein